MNNLIILGTAHGVNVPGKCSPDKSLREYAWSRDMCKRVAAGLKARGVPVVIDIEGEREESLGARVRLVNNIAKQHGGAALYVSIHNNAAGADGKWHNARGFCVYAYTGASGSSRSAASIFHRRAQAAGLKGNRSYPATGYYTANFAVLRGTSCPAVLTENLFQDNRDDVALLLSDEGRAKIAALHVDSICEFLGV